MKILRLGSINPPTSRLLDLLNSDCLEKITLYLKENEVQYIQDLYDTATFFNVEYLLKKIEIKKYSELKVLSKLYRKIGEKLHSKCLIRMAYLYLARELKRCKIYDYDAIWIGENDFDGSNHIFVAMKPFFPKEIPVIRSYKETRFKKNWAEYVTLSNVGHLIIPSCSYIDFFKDLYNLKLYKTSFADLDWRYSKTIKWVKEIKEEKLSVYDRRPHVCILTGRALSDTTEIRSGHRYYFIPVIKELIERGIAVHLHATRIVIDKYGRNAYAEISRGNDLFTIEKTLKLTAGSNDYRILKRYDAGIMHPQIPIENYALKKFQQINIPNRIYEYQIADVVPLVQAGTSKDVERLIKNTNFGIIFKDYDELSIKLFGLIDMKIQIHMQEERITSYKKFASTLIHAIKSMK